MPPEDRQRRSSTMGIVIGVIALVLVGGGAYYAWQSQSASAPVETPPVPVIPVDDRVSYASSTMGIALKYPKGYVASDSYSNVSVNPKKPIQGVKLTVPTEIVSGTNLAMDTGISVEQLPRANNCSGDIYLAANVRGAKLLEGSATYSVATSSTATTGNLIEEMVYAIASSSPCTAVRYFIHSTDAVSTSTRAFDRAALILEFDKIRQSLVLQ